jgi:hypothetical protein
MPRLWIEGRTMNASNTFRRIGLAWTSIPARNTAPVTMATLEPQHRGRPQLSWTIDTRSQLTLGAVRVPWRTRQPHTLNRKEIPTIDEPRPQSGEEMPPPGMNREARRFLAKAERSH